MAFLTDLADRIGGFFNGAGQAIGNEAHQLPQQIQHFVQPAEQQASNFVHQVPQQAINFGNLAGSFGQHLGQVVGNTANQANYDFWHSPVGQGAVNAQRFLNSSAPTTIVPQLKPFNNNNLGGQVGNMAANIPGQLANSIIGHGIIDPALDMGREIGSAVTGQQLPQYNTLKSGATKLGYQIGGLVNPSQKKDLGINENAQNTLGNAADTAMPILNAYVPKGAANIVEGGVEQVAKQGFGQALKSGAISGAEMGGIFGALQGLVSGRNGTLQNQLLESGKQGAIGAATGGAAGGITSGASYGIGKIVNSISSVIQKVNPQASKDEVNALTQQYIRDRAGKFAKGQSTQELPLVAGMGNKVLDRSKPPIINDWMSQVDQNLGVPNPQAGFINFDAKIGGKSTQLPSEQQIPLPGISQNPQSSEQSLSNSIPQGVKERGFTTSVKESPEVSAGVQKGVNTSYTPQANQTLIDQSSNLVGSGLNKATNNVMGVLNGKAGSITDQGVSDAISVAKAQDAKGNFDQATQIYDKLAEHLTQAGRTVQAASLLDNRTPQGLLYSSIATLKKAGVELTPEINTNLKGFVDGIKQTNPGSDERSLATQQLVKYVNNSIPRSKVAAGIGIWRAGLLTGPETLAKVSVSHGLTTPFELASQIPADLTDRMMSLVTGKRSTTATLRGGLSGLGEGLQGAAAKIKSGIDLPNTGGFANDFGSTTHQTAYENFVGGLHGALSKPAYATRYNISLNDQALTEATNQGLNGAEKQAFIKNFLANPSDAVKTVANLDAQIATNQQTTSMGKLASNMQQWNVMGVPIGKILTPFTRIPSAIGTNGIVNYTPFGIGKEVVDQVQKGVFNQRTMAQAVGRATTGTTVLALGSLLAANNLMTLKAPADAKERSLWELQGKQPNSINMNGKWISLNAFGPVGITLAVGAGLQQSLANNKGDLIKAIPDAVATGGRVILDQPYLKGISGVANALNDPTRFGTTFFNNTVGSVVPALSQQIARGTDTVQRTFPKDLSGKFQSEIPGLRQNITPQQDLFGNTLPGSNPSGSVVGGIMGTVNPFYPSSAKSDPVSSELQRLYDSLGSSGSPSIGQPNAKQTINGQKMQLNPQQLSSLISAQGPQIKDAVGQLIQSPDYQSLSDEEKTNAINSVLTSTKKQINGSIDLGNPTVTAGNTIPKGNKYTLVNPDTGNVKTIDLSKSIDEPTPTGNTQLDKKLLSSYNSALTTRANDIVALYKAGKMDAPTAEAALEKLAASKVGTGKAKKGKKLTIKTARISPIKTIKFKMSKQPKIKLSKSPTLKISKAKAPIKFKIAQVKQKFSSRQSLTA